jgi:hypothetical protein
VVVVVTAEGASEVPDEELGTAVQAVLQERAR